MSLSQQHSISVEKFQVCPTCKVEKQIKDFKHLNRNVLCKNCASCREKMRNGKTKTAVSVIKKKVLVAEKNKEKKCTTCKHSFPLEDFKNNKDPENYLKTCIKCRTRDKKKPKCPHGKRKSECKDCKGGSVCCHDRIKSTCKDCKGSSFCEHGKQKSRCRTCGGKSFCEHDIRKSICKECKKNGTGGNELCGHYRRKTRCELCLDETICEHKEKKGTCESCIFDYTNEQDKKKLEKDGVVRNGGIRKHIESQFHDGMCWENYGNWEFDHRTPIRFCNPTFEEIIERLHYTNVQPLWAVDNRKKGNRWVG